MNKLNGRIKYIEDWYNFYKSINNKNIKLNWLVELTLEFYEEKLTELYYQKDNMYLNTMDLDDVNFFSASVSHNTTANNSLRL